MRIYYNKVIKIYYTLKDPEETIMLEKVQAMLADALGVSADKITSDARIIEDLGADSLDVVELLSRLEDEYGITIPEDDVENLKTVGDIVTELEKISK